MPLVESAIHRKRTARTRQSTGVWTNRREAELIRHLHEKLAAVIDVSLGRIEYACSRDYVQNLQIAVVSDVDCRAGMHQIGDQEIGVKLFRSWQKSVQGRCAWGIGQQRVVLQNHPQGKLRRELPVPLATQNVVVEDPVTGSNRPQPLEEIRILNLQRLQRTECERAVRRILSGQKRRHVRRRHEVYSVAPVVPASYRHLWKVTGLDGNSTAVFVIVLIVR